jgi:xeroderma pigmentosum group C-complementing protein
MSTVGRNRDEPARRRRKLRSEPTDHESGNIEPEAEDVISVKSESESSDEDEFEDVDLNLPAEPPHQVPIDDKPLVIPLVEAPQPAKKRKLNHISKEQRVLRKQMHQIYIVMMIIHGGIRNRWCNDYDLMTSLKKRVPRSISQLLSTKDKTVLNVVKSRRLLDGLKQLMLFFNKNLVISSKGLILKNWHELGQIRSKRDKNVTFERFKELVLTHRGSRDIAAQGFVSLLRSFGLNARLVFSLQPPDFTSIIDTTPHVEIDDRESKKTTVSRLNDSKNSLLASVRFQSQTTSEASEEKPKLQDSKIPIFWVEVWDNYSSKWVSMDPICMKIIEIPPKRRKCSFEPPSTDPRNQLIYAIATTD